MVHLLLAAATLLNLAAVGCLAVAIAAWREAAAARVRLDDAYDVRPTLGSLKVAAKRIELWSRLQSRAGRLLASAGACQGAACAAFLMARLAR